MGGADKSPAACPRHALINPCPNKSPNIRMNNHVWLKAPKNTSRINSAGQSQNNPRPNKNFARPQASFIPVPIIPTSSINIKIINNISLTTLSLTLTSVDVSAVLQPCKSHYQFQSAPA